jgi:hypothetical protein
LKCVVAYLFVMVGRIMVTLVTGEPISSFYEYITCSLGMLTILGVVWHFKRAGMDNNHVVFLNQFIPINIMVSAIYHMSNMEASHYES